MNPGLREQTSSSRSYPSFWEPKNQNQKRETPDPTIIDSNFRFSNLIFRISQKLLPYRGLGSGIKRALAEWANIEFTNNENAGLFTSTIQRESSGEIGKTAISILQAIQLRPSITIPELSNKIGITERAIEKQIRKLRETERLRRTGPNKGGHWEVI